MGDRRVGVRWLEPPDGSSPAGRPAEMTLIWPDSLPLPAVGELLETAKRTVLEVTALSYYVGNGIPEPILLCKWVSRG